MLILLSYPPPQIPCYLIDEYKTSSMCPLCGSEIERGFRQRPSSRPWQRARGRMETVHGLLACTNTTCLQSLATGTESESGTDTIPTRRYWNRDRLATSNMLVIVESLMQGHGRPAIYSRAHRDPDPQMELDQE